MSRQEAVTAAEGYDLRCPYCGHTDHRLVSTPRAPTSAPWEVRGRLGRRAEVRTAPYTRDVERFDPEPYRPWDDPARGSWIGSDFMTWLRWDQRFGILTSRIADWPGVWYRTEDCTACHRHYDAYYLFHQESTLAEHFPHLFAAPGDDLPPPDATPMSFAVLDRMVRPRTGLDRTGRAARLGIVWFLLAVILMAGARGLSGRFDGWELLLASGSLLIGVAVAVLLLAWLDHLLRWFADPYAFDQVLRVDGPPGDETARLNHVRHWVSFTHARFTGRPGRRTGLRTTTEALGGAMALVTMALAIWLGTPDRVELAVRAVDALLWLPVAYLLGSSLQLAGISVHYVLAGLTRIPLRMDRFDPTTALPAVRAVQAYARRTALTAGLGLVTLLALNATYVALSPQPLSTWVDTWIVLIVLVSLIFLALTLRQPAIFALAASTAVLASLSTQGYLAQLHLPGVWATLDLRTLIFGGAFTLYLLWEARQADELVDRAVLNTIEADGVRVLRSGDADAIPHLDVERALVELRTDKHGRAQWAPLVASLLLPTVLQLGVERLLG